MTDIEDATWFPDGQTYAELADELAAAKAEIERLRAAVGALEKELEGAERDLTWMRINRS